MAKKKQKVFGGFNAPVSGFLWAERLLSNINYEAVDLDQYDNYGYTALTFAIANEHYDLARKLIDAGANVSVANYYNFSPIFGLIYAGRLDLINLFIERLDDLDIRNPNQKTALDVATEMWNLPIISALINTGRCELSNFIEYVVLNNKLYEFINYATKNMNPDIFLPLQQRLLDRDAVTIEGSDDEDVCFSSTDVVQMACSTPIAEQNDYEVDQELRDMLNRFGVDMAINDQDILFDNNQNLIIPDNNLTPLLPPILPGEENQVGDDNENHQSIPFFVDLLMTPEANNIQEEVDREIGEGDFGFVWDQDSVSRILNFD
jgi:hypothetical protein